MTGSVSSGVEGARAAAEGVAKKAKDKVSRKGMVVGESRLVQFRPLASLCAVHQPYLR